MPCGDALPHEFDLSELFLPVLGQDFAGFLKALVGDLLEGDVIAGLDGGATSAGSYGVFVLVVQE